jgi:hypothetical protein
VVADELVGTSANVTLRRVTYQDQGTVYIYLTNLPLSVPPGIVALLYKSRWGTGVSVQILTEFGSVLLFQHANRPFCLTLLIAVGTAVADGPRADPYVKNYLIRLLP